MPVQTNEDVATTQIERVYKKVEYLFERNYDLLRKIDVADAEQVSTKLMRIPLETMRGGNYGGYNPNGGNVGRGSGPLYDQGTLGPIYRKMGFELTFLAEMATNSPEKAVINATNRLMNDAQELFRMALDKELNGGPGNAVLGTISSIVGTTLTMAVPNGAQLVYEGQTVAWYDTTLTIFRGTAQVIQADPVIAQTITVDAVPAGGVATDVLVVNSEQNNGANPVGLFGVKYHQSNATTGTWLNLNRAAYPVQLRTPRVNGNNAALVPMQPELAINLIRKSVGLKAPGKLSGYCAVEQKHGWGQLSTTVQIIDRARHEQGETVDMNPTNSMKGYDSFRVAGVPSFVGQNADQTRFDFFDFGVWLRAVIKPMGFMKFAEGAVWYQAYGNDGGPASSRGFVLEYDFQVATRNPRKGAYIDALARPQGY